MDEPFADAVIVAAGSSRRMGGVDKLDAPIGDRSVLQRAAEAVSIPGLVSRTVIVTAAHRVSEMTRRPWVRDRGFEVVPGGERRQESVAAGVAATSARVVLVHDGARPSVSRRVVEDVARAADRFGAAIPVIPQSDALKRVAGDRVLAGVERDGVMRAQTPQGARRDLLAAALSRHAGGPMAADEAELLARDGVAVVAVPGDPSNLKITLPEDLEAVRRSVPAAGRARIGQGWDRHPFGPGDGLRLGGLAIEGAPRLHGHSDGDVVIHALCDALLGAAGLGDLGRLFPSGDGRTEGIDSTRLLEDVLGRVAEVGLSPSQADVSIRGSRPRLGGDRLDAMAERLAGILGIDRGRVGVKAATGNLAGDEGAGRAMGAACLVVLEPR